jgi:hypothetical protein
MPGAQACTECVYQTVGTVAFGIGCRKCQIPNATRKVRLQGRNRGKSEHVTHHTKSIVPTRSRFQLKKARPARLSCGS